VAEGVVIRPERDADHAAIAEVVRAAFVEHPDEVASFVERIRASEQFIPELALVAEDSSGVVAHVMLTWVGVEGGSRTRILNLTPMSVRPDRQRIGVGARLGGSPRGHLLDSREDWGHGFATRALQEFLQVEATRPVYARAASDNAASIRVLTKCGFRIVGEGREFAHGRNEDTDEVVLRLDA
jgi:RimJ/RimL family protein N-acetyltransferase